ncbi:MAG: YARHG domain-containing protein [Flavobacteriales bacterium]
MNKYFIIAVVLLAACGGEPEKREHPVSEAETTTGEKTETDSVQTIAEETDIDTSALLGYYVGDFVADELDEEKDPSYSNRINISVNSIKGNKVYGHSVVAGNKRSFEGDITQKKGISLLVEVKEPGDDKYDGEFIFELNRFGAKGEWNAYDKKLAVTKRTYDLKPTAFAYSPATDTLTITGTTLLSDKYYYVNFQGEVVNEEAAKFNASVAELKKEDVENMSAGNLELMRNAIYARHGYSFKNRKMRYYFDKYEGWYIPVTTDVRKDLTALEKKNIDLIKRYEEHAARYYDSFGR